MKSSSPHGREVRGAVHPSERLLAEAVRALEGEGSALADDPAAEAAARAAGGTFEARLVRRAASLASAEPLREALRWVRQVSTWIVAGVLVLAAVTGAGAARAALAASGGGGSAHGEHAAVNFFWALTSLLGVQMILLLAWLALMIVRPRAVDVSPLGGAVLSLGRWIAARANRERHHVAALRAATALNARGPVGRWTLSAISHAVWTAANVGAIVLLVVLLSTREYAFHWETTILSSETYERITRAVSSVPSRLGFSTPSPEQIAATEAGLTTADPAAARAWSGLLVGALATYALAPRGLLMLLCLLARSMALRRARLDTSAPGYLELRPRLMPGAESRGVVNGDDGAPLPVHGPVASASGPLVGGAPAIVGLEIVPPRAWPPRLTGVRWTDLGAVDGREDRRRAALALEALPEPPRITAVVCALTTTPDRGVGAAIEQIARAARGPVGLLLTAGEQLRRRSGPPDVEQRVEDWRRLAAEAGVAPERVLETDLDHLTDASRRRLASFVGADPAAQGPAVPPRGLEAAFARIDEAAGGWTDTPSARDLGALHRAIAEIYRHEPGGLRAFVRMPDGPGDVTTALRESAQRAVTLLPDRLKQSPRWMLAGAVGGTLGCVAIGTLLAPAAFAAIPAWATGGAGVGALLQLARRGRDDDAGPGDAEPTVDEAVRGSALFAMLLELQGRDEPAITRILDGAVDDDDGTITGPTCRAWLDELRHRFDLAVQAEARA